MDKLEVLSLSENPIEQIPDCFKYMTELRRIDFFGLQLSSLPNCLIDFKKLEYLDVQGMLFKEKTQNFWKDKLPECTILFDAPCNCLEAN